MACGSRCHEKYPFSIVVRPHQPPPGGWTLKELPPFVTEERLRWAWRQRSLAQNGSPYQAVEEVGGFLRQNGGAFTPRLKWETSEFADAYWCSLDPSRCRQSAAPEPEQSKVMPQELPKMKMQAAKRLWEVWNATMASDHEDPATVMHNWAQAALHYVASEAGCKECHQHWSALLQAYPPAALCTSNPRARVWLWACHNYSREGLPPTPYADVEKGWRWPKLTPQQVQSLLAEMGLDKLKR